MLYDYKIKAISLLLNFLMCLTVFEIKTIKHKISKVFTVTCVDVFIQFEQS